jgi:hypothetical protein
MLSYLLMRRHNDFYSACSPIRYIKVKWPRYRPGVAQRVGRGIALLFHDLGTRRGWVVNVTPRPYFTPGKDPVPIVQEPGWAPGPVWTGAENLALAGIWSPDRPARSQSLNRLNYPAHPIRYIMEHDLFQGKHSCWWDKCIRLLWTPKQEQKGLIPGLVHWLVKFLYISPQVILVHTYVVLKVFILLDKQILVLLIQLVWIKDVVWKTWKSFKSFYYSGVCVKNFQNYLPNIWTSKGIYYSPLSNFMLLR